MTHPLFYEEFCDALAAAGINVVSVHLEGHGKSPRVGRLLRLESLVANVLDATAWARVRFGRCPVVVGSSQGGVLAMIVATRDHELAGVVAHNILDPELPASITVSRFPTFLQGAYRPLMRGLRVLAMLLPRLPIRFSVSRPLMIVDVVVAQCCPPRDASRLPEVALALDRHCSKPE